MKSKRKKPNKKPHLVEEKTCVGCDNCVYAEEGDFVCIEHSKLVVEDWIPADDFYFCGGKDYIENETI